MSSDKTTDAGTYVVAIDAGTTGIRSRAIPVGAGSGVASYREFTQHFAALAHGKPVFIEKPMAADLAGAAAMLRQAGTLATMMDFNFTEIMAWRKAKALLDVGAIGRLRHVAVNWNVENSSTRLRLKNWKTSGDDGGGALGNFGSHSLHYLEWFVGPIADLSARLSGLPDDPSFETNVVLDLAFQSPARPVVTP